MPETTFSRLVRRELPSHVVAEDERTFAFLDINPATPGHTLVVPRKPAADLFEASDEDVAAVALMVKRVAGLLERALKPAGLNVVQSNRAAAGQEVFHYHVHVLPRYVNDGVRLEWNALNGLDLTSLAARLREADGGEA